MNIPILAKCNVKDKFYGKIGPQTGYLLSSDLQAEGECQELGELNSWDLTLNSGLVYNLLE